MCEINNNIEDIIKELRRFVDSKKFTENAKSKMYDGKIMAKNFSLKSGKWIIIIRHYNFFIRRRFSNTNYKTLNSNSKTFEQLFTKEISQVFIKKFKIVSLG